MGQITLMQVDASEEAAIQGVCETAVQQEGRLDVFFANVRYNSPRLLAANPHISAQAAILGSRPDITVEEETLENFMRVLKNNVGSYACEHQHKSCSEGPSAFLPVNSWL